MQSVSVSTFNLNGPGVDGWKLSDPNLLHRISQNDIFGILESWSNINDDCTIQLDNYYTFNLCRNLSRNARRASGGIICLIKKTIKPGVRVLCSKSNNLLWLELKSDFFQLNKPIFLCLCYIPHVDSPHLGNTWDILQDEIISYSTKGYIMLSGDFNSRIGGEFDFIEGDSTHHIPVDPGFYDCDSGNLIRRHRDQVVNSHGKTLLDICTSGRLRLLNGRKIGDFYGNFTYYKVCKDKVFHSTIDYAIVSEELVNSTCHFVVHPFDLSLSDHCQISFDILLNTPLSFPSDVHNFRPLPRKYIWNESSKVNFSNAFKSEAMKLRLQCLVATQYSSDQIGVDLAINDLNQIYHDVADACLNRTKIPRKQNSQTSERHFKKKSKPWFNADLKQIRCEIRSLSKSLSHCPSNLSIASQLRKKCNLYNKMIKVAKRESKEILISRLCEAEKNNPKLFWDTMKILNGTKKSDPLAGCDPSSFVKHFEHLVNPTNLSASNTLTNDSNTILNGTNNPNHDLNKPFTIREIKKSIRKLKNGKAVGLDLISNEMIKSSADDMLPSITKIFNLILANGNSPGAWRFGYITPLYKKKGARDDPNNYRGITVTNCLCKLFSSVLNQRLTDYLNSNGILSNLQSGFRKESRTSDNIFVIRTIVNKYFSMSKKLYCCFIDFQKAFDRIWHKGLFLKMKMVGINGNFLRYIQNSYSSMESCVKFSSGLSDFFKVKVGTRQGDVLSPTLFNLFINDIVDSLNDANPHPVLLESFKITTLLYADDLVIFSTSPEGLQSTLDALSVYCEKWHLQVNVNKSKVMIFESRRSANCLLRPKFKFNNEVIEEVSEFSYLGTVFDYKCNFNKGVDILSKKAAKAMFVLMKNINANNICPKTALHLFDSYIQPILTYNCEIWGFHFIKLLSHTDSIKFMKSLDKCPFESVLLKFCKWVLGVNRFTSNCGTRAEFGMYPMLFYIYKHCLSFIDHLKKSENPVLQMALKEDEKLNTSLSKSILDIANSLGCDQDPPDGDICIESLQKKYDGHFFEFLHCDQRSDKGQKSKLRTYRQFKKEYSFEPYLSVIKSRILRSKFAKFRLSNHELMIEKGRHSRVHSSQRLCPFGCNAIEDEAHFFGQCPINNEIRVNFMLRTSYLFDPGGFISSSDFFNLMSSCDEKTIFDVVHFVDLSMSNRKVMLQKQ